jgi:hypothetical protein
VKKNTNKHIEKHWCSSKGAQSKACVGQEMTDKYTYHSRFILEGVAEVSQIFLQGTHVLPKLVNTADVTGG